MKKLIFTFLLVNLFSGLMADELVMLNAKTSQDVRFLAQLENLTINYQGNGFVVATNKGMLKEEFMLIDNNAWQPGQNYFLIFVNKTKNPSYLAELKNISQILCRRNN